MDMNFPGISPNDNKKRLLTAAVITVIGTAVSLCATQISLSAGMYTVLGGIGILFVSALCGSYPGLLSVFIVFIFRTYIDGAYAYVMFLYMLGSMIVAWASSSGCFKKLWKSILLGLVTAFFIGSLDLWVSHVTLGSALEADMLARDFWVGYTTEFAECILFSICCYLIFRFLPEKYKLLLPQGIFYMDNETEARYFRTRLRHQAKLSLKISALVITEAVILTMAAAYFANMLIGSINFDMVPPREQRDGEAAPPEKPEEEQDLERMIQTAVQQGEDEIEITRRYILSSNMPEGMKINFLARLDRISSEVSGNNVFRDFREVGHAFDNANLDRKTAIAFDIRLIMLLATFATPVVLITNAFAQHSVAFPIVQMSRAMDNFVAYSDEEKRYEGRRSIEALNIHTHDEIGGLYQSLVTTVRNIDNYLNRLKAEEELQNNLKVAQAASDAKSAFLSSMSHEIRTPINAVLGFDEMILMENKDPDIEKYAEDIQSAGKSLLALINDILDFSKIEAGKMDIIPVEYELSSTINDLISMISTLARDKGLYFDVNVDSAMPHILVGDEIRLKQIMLNILTNAVKYTEKGGITFNIGFEKIDEEQIYFIVHIKDTGIGIREEDKDRLFSPFERLDEVNEAKNRSVKGTGLGLSITKQLLQKMDSALEVDSVFGEGSDFHFKVVQKVGKWEEVGNLAEAFKKYLPHEAEKHKNDNFFAPDAKILVVDDTENNLLVVQRLLKRTKIQIDTAPSGEEALKMICRNVYDIVYLDHMMPEMDGIETLKAMKGMTGNLNEFIPWIVLTANAVSGARETYMEAGFTDYMTKPVNYLSLKNSLLKYLPKEKIQILDEGEQAMQEESTEAQEEAGAAVDPALREKLMSIGEIHYQDAIRNSGGEDILIDVMKGYAQSVPEKSALIEQYSSSGDYKNYTIQVHALKSSSRLIGAMDLSRMAEGLEASGNAAQGSGPERLDAVSRIAFDTPKLLSQYRSLGEKLSVLEEKPKDGLSEIPEAELKEILSAIREFADAFDFDDVDAAMKQLEDYRVPEAYTDRIAALKTMAMNVDRDGILGLLREDQP
ncbi:MAG: response regulator [Lachnospiraceae bacterium]|nr:response regulator [Lachnospiraceae bacterium]